MTTGQTCVEDAARPYKPHGDFLPPGESAKRCTIAVEKVRYPKPLIVIPVLPDGLPDREGQTLGVSLDIGPDGGLELFWENPPALPTSALMALEQQADGTIRAIGIEALTVHTPESGGVKVEGRIGGFAEEILNPNNLTPAFDARTLDFALGLPDEMLDRWAGVGALEAFLVDRVRVCPRCGRLPTFRPGCPNCGSAQLENDVLIHHFACAHVGRVGEYETDDGLTCPKCRMRQLIVASDFDYVTGPYRCLDCGWSNLEPEDVAQCLNCRFRFPAYQTETRELRGFRANRLDLLAVLPPH